MKEIVSLAALLALCISAVAVDVPNMIGNWTETAQGVGYLTNTNWQATGNFSYWDENNTYVITEQNGTRFAGKVIPVDNSMSAERVVGVIDADHNNSIFMVDEGGVFWGEMLSPTEMELFYQKVGADGIEVTRGLLTKE
jgi:hypothetical protein